MAHSAEGHYAHKLLNDLMENYSGALRPVEDTDRALNVTLQITLSQIKDMVCVSRLPETQACLKMTALRTTFLLKMGVF